MRLEPFRGSYTYYEFSAQADPDHIAEFNIYAARFAEIGINENATAILQVGDNRQIHVSSLATPDGISVDIVRVYSGDGVYPEISMVMINDYIEGRVAGFQVDSLSSGAIKVGSMQYLICEQRALLPEGVEVSYPYLACILLNGIAERKAGDSIDDFSKFISFMQDCLSDREFSYQGGRADAIAANLLMNHYLFEDSPIFKGEIRDSMWKKLRRWWDRFSSPPFDL